MRLGFGWFRLDYNTTVWALPAEWMVFVLADYLRGVKHLWPAGRLLQVSFGQSESAG